jgi:hypothetical protein
MRIIFIVSLVLINEVTQCGSGSSNRKQKNKGVFMKTIGKKLSVLFVVAGLFSGLIQSSQAADICGYSIEAKDIVHRESEYGNPGEIAAERIVKGGAKKSVFCSPNSKTLLLVTEYEVGSSGKLEYTVESFTR